MDSIRAFIWPAIFLLFACSGLIRFFFPERVIKAERIKVLHKEGRKAEAESLAKQPARDCVTTADTERLKNVRLFGFFRFVFMGALFLYSGFAVAWIGGVPVRKGDNPGGGLEEMVEKHCKPFVEEGGSVGLVVVAVSGTNETVMTFGRPAAWGKAGLAEDAMFEIGSITKVFTGIALASEAGKGTVKLDQPITSLLPEGMELPEPARKVTLEHLTRHRSGFPRLPAGVGLMALLRMATFGGDPYRGFDEEKMRAALRGVSLESEPGAKMEYSNFGTGLLGWLLANRAGKSYEDYIRSEVCQPLGMADTRVTLSSEQAARFAQGYRATLKLGPVLFALRSSPWELSNPLAGAGALRSNGPDMLRFLKANMHPDDSELGRAIRASQAERRKEPAGQSVAMNWMRTKSAKVGRTIIWHNGGTGGFRSFLGFTEDGQAGVVVLSNVSRSVDELGVELLKDLAAQTSNMTVN